MGLGIFGAVFSLLYPYVVLHNVKINKFYSHIVFMNMKKSDGRIIQLKQRECLKVEMSDSIIIETPGGGGYGKVG